VKSEHRYGVIAALCVGFLFLASGLWAQEATVPRHVGYPQDWSSNSLVFSLDGLAKYPDLIDRESRVRHQLMQRFQMREPGSFSGVVAGAKSHSKLSPQVTWPIALTRGKVAANMFPAKFSFDPGAAPSCQNDFVVFGLDVGGKTGGQANLIGINNLYSGTNGFCGAAPTVLFAYNVTTATGGIVTTSPVISEDGTEIAFVESVSGATPSAIFHVLTWAPTSNTITTAAAPTMVSVTFSSTNPSTTSSPWVDYASDTAYVADDGGNVYQITGVFKGPLAVSGPPWPVPVSGGRLSPTVLDNRLQKLVVAARTGNLYTIDITTATISGTLPIGKSGSITAPPIVDVTNGTTFIVSSTDGTSAVLVEADTATLTSPPLAKARIGLGAGTGGGATLTIPQPALSNGYYNNPATGVIRLCGTGASDTTPWQYAFAFTGQTMNITPVFSQQIVNAAATCTNWTEFFNPHIGTIGTDFFFFGLNQNCVGTSGCVVAATTLAAPLTITAVAGGPSGIVIDNYGTDPQEANIYLTAEGAGVSTAYKFSQNGLQ